MSEIPAATASAAVAAVKDIAHPVSVKEEEEEEEEEEESPANNNLEKINGNKGHTNGDVTADAGILEALCHDLRRKVDGFLKRQIHDNEVLRSTQDQVRVATGVIDEALRRYRPEELSLSYNGGKDCLVLLILILASLPSHFPSHSTSSNTTKTATIPTPADLNSSTPSKPSTTTTSSAPTTTSSRTTFPTSFQALYIRPPSPFPEVDDFVAETTARYHLDLATSNKPMKAALTEYLSNSSSSSGQQQEEEEEEEQEERRGEVVHGRGKDVRAVFVGTRRTDPHGQFLSHFDETDRDWPRFMRVHPVVDWHYREVWGFIRALEIPYCPLYDKGYTSLGGTDDTHPNPALLLQKDDGAAKVGNGGAGGEEKGKADRSFRPAYELMEDGEERLGRDR